MYPIHKNNKVLNENNEISKYFFSNPRAPIYILEGIIGNDYFIPKEKSKKKLYFICFLNILFC